MRFRTRTVNDLSWPATLWSVALALLLSTSAPSAQEGAQCAGTADRAAGLQVVRLPRSLSDLGIVMVPQPDSKLVPIDISAVEGPCAGSVQAVRMTQIAFDDGVVFSGQRDGTYAHTPGRTGLADYPGTLLANPPLIENAQFIMASRVDGFYRSDGPRSLDVGVWKEGTGYLVAAFTRQEGSAGKPIALLRTTRRVKSVTYFPAPDTHAGRLTMLLHDAGTVALVSFDWDHAGLTRAMRSGQ